MTRPRTASIGLPKYVGVNNGAYWYRAPKTKAVRICAIGDTVALYTFLADLARGVPSGPIATLNDCFDRFERECVPRLAPRTQIDYRSHLKILRQWCGHMRPDELKPRDIGKFLDVEKGRVSRNKTVGVLSAVYSKAIGRWYVCENNPCMKVERNETHKRTRYITDAEYTAFRGFVSERLQIAMDLALLTGQRQGDLLSLKWEQCDSKARLLSFQQGKTGKRLAVEISDALEQVLLRAKTLRPHLPRVYVLRTEEGKRYTSAGFRALWQRYMKRAAKGYKIKAKKGAPWTHHEPLLKERFTFHDIRAKSVSDSATLQEAFERAGHTSMAMTRGTYDRGTRKVKPLR